MPCLKQPSNMIQSPFRDLYISETLNIGLDLGFQQECRHKALHYI